MKHTITKENIARFQEELRMLERSQATIEKYSRDLLAFYRWLADGKELDKETVMAYKMFLSERYAPTSVNSMLAALRAFFSFMEWRDCDVKMLKIQRRIFGRKERELSKEEYERLVETAEERGNQRLYLLLQIMASTGIRVSEMQYITVESAQQGKAEITLKGKIRVILLPGKLCRKLLKYAKKEKIASGQLILTRSGRPMNRKEIWAQMKNLCKAAGVDAQKVFPHNLRHLFARIFYRAQRDIAKLADLLGHSSIETTRIYLLASGDEHRRDIEQLGLIS